MEAAAGERVINQGEQGDNFYVVESGQLVIKVAHGGGPPVRYGDLGPGDRGRKNPAGGPFRSLTPPTRTRTHTLVVSASTRRFVVSVPRGFQASETSQGRRRVCGGGVARRGAPR